MGTSINMEDWEHRRPNEQTCDYLGRVLEDYLGYRELAIRARLGHFDDYFCPEEIADGLEIVRLIRELNTKAENIIRNTPQRKRIEAVVKAVKEGEFDGTKEESERWAVSAGGQRALNELPPSIRKHFE